MKKCARCKILKSTDEFNRDTRFQDKIKGTCKTCISNYSKEWYRRPENLARLKEKDRAYRRELYSTSEGRATTQRKVRKYKYKLTEQQFNDLLIAQGGVCAICKTDKPGGKHGTWSVDHDHSCCPGDVTCGKCIRGLLCNKCNQASGLFRDNPFIVAAAALYLFKNSKPANDNN